MKEILIEDYISNHKEANETITNFSKNKLIIKGSTGIGGTSAVLAINNQSVIIISPYLGMIQSKEKQNTKWNNYFIYQSSNNRWGEIECKMSLGEQFILNTTPDQILYIQKHNPKLFDKVKRIPLFIDECHIASECDYRKALAEFNHLVFNEWENHFILSTATPVFKNLDIPKSILDHIDIIKISRKAEAIKDISIYDYDFYPHWIYQEIRRGNKVVLFSNDKNVYRRFMTDENIKSQQLVGVHLEKQVATYRDHTEKPLSSDLELDNQLYILSTKYLTGFDIPFDASVAIIANEKNYTDKKYINDIVQAYGRVRNNILNAAIFYNRNDFIETITNNEFIEKINALLTRPHAKHLTNGIVNHTLILNDHLETILRRDTYNSIETLGENLKPYGFNPIIFDIELNKIDLSDLRLFEKIRNVKTLDLPELKRYAEYVFHNIGGDEESYNGFSDRLILIYAAAIISKICNNQWLERKLSKIERYTDLINVLKTFIDVNTEPFQEQLNPKKWFEIDETINQFDAITRFRVTERQIKAAIIDGAICDLYKENNMQYTVFGNSVFLINTFHAINLVQMNRVDNDTLQSMEIKARISEVIKDDYLKGVSAIADTPIKKLIQLIENNTKTINDIMFNRHIRSFFKHSFNKVVRNLSFTPTKEQIESIELKIEKYKNTLSKSTNERDSIKFKLSLIDYSIEKQKEYHRNYLLGMASLHIAGHMAGFRCSTKSSRQYNIATKVPRSLRYKYIPYKMVEVDITSVNPQIIDSMIGSKVGLEVYDNLMKSYSITRDKAKVLYNKTINNQGLQKDKAVEVYLSAGYPPEYADKLAGMTTSRRIYDSMCAEEAYTIGTYKAVTKVQNSIRIHDALIFLATAYNTNNLPTKINSTVYKVSYY